MRKPYKQTAKYQIMLQRIKKAEFLIYCVGIVDLPNQKVNKGAWGFVFVKDNKPFFEATGTEINTTFNRMEVLALLNAVRAINEYNIKKLVILSNSQYAVNGFQTWIGTWVKNNFVRGTPPEPVPNADLWREVNEETEECKGLEIYWIKRDEGGEWNKYIANKLMALINIPVKYA